jgi:hypothetical protein
MAKYTTCDCQTCGEQPTIDVIYPNSIEEPPKYQFVCWLDNIYGNVSFSVEHAAESWNGVNDGATGS